MADIFLSYNEKDRDAVRRLAETLKSVGWSVWWDRRIPAGGTWRSLLEHELEAMRCMIVVWSANSIKSDWVFEEATEGRTKGCLVPVCIEAVRPPPGFREIQAADLVGWDGTATFLGMRALIEDIEQRIGKPSTSVACDTIHVAADVHAVVEGLATDEVHERHERHESIDLSQIRSPPVRPTPILSGTSAVLSRRSIATMAGVALTALLASGVYVAVERPAKNDDLPGSAEIQTFNNGPLSGTSGRLNPADPSNTTEAANTAANIAADTAAAAPANDAANAGLPVQDVLKAATNTNRKPSDDLASTSHCADLMQRVSLGETLSSSANLAWQKCAKKK